MTINKLIRYLTSLGLAIALFIMIAAYSIIGTVLPQGLQREFYIESYNSFGNIILALQFNQVYSSWIFRILLGIFMVNLVGCTLKIIPSQFARLKDAYFPQPKSDGESYELEGTKTIIFREILKRNRFKIIETESGFRASKDRIGSIGSSVTHLGIIIIVLGSFLGNMFAEEGFFNLVPGDIKAFPDYNFSMRLDDFYLGFRDNNTVEQYYSEVTILVPGQQGKKDKLWVNKPVKVQSLNFYQTSYGWASRMSIKDNSGEILESRLLRRGESYFYQPSHMTVYLYGYYPDFNITSQGEPLTMSEKELNPHYAVVIYQFNNHIGSYVLEPGQTIDMKDFTISFDDSVMYTGITYRKDFGYFFVLLGSFAMLLGLILSFYMYPKFVVVDNGRVTPITRQNSWGFNYQIKKMLAKSAEREVS
jgi:cytochrome c biogenesis protein